MWQRYGADTVRGYLMFIGPWDQGGPWDPSAIEGVSRFLYRVWSVVVGRGHAERSTAEPSADEVRALERKLHQTIIKVTDDMAELPLQHGHRRHDGAEQHADQGQGDARSSARRSGTRPCAAWC